MGRVMGTVVFSLLLNAAEAIDLITGTLALSLPLADLATVEMVAAVRASVAAATDGITAADIIVDAVCGADGLTGCATPPTRRTLRHHGAARRLAERVSPARPSQPAFVL